MRRVVFSRLRTVRNNNLVMSPAWLADLRIGKHDALIPDQHLRYLEGERKLALEAVIVRVTQAEQWRRSQPSRDR